MKYLYSVICDNGDGSQSLDWFVDDPTVDNMEKELKTLLEKSQWHQSGDGVQTKRWVFPDDFDTVQWAKDNYLGLYTIEQYRKNYL